MGRGPDGTGNANRDLGLRRLRRVATACLLLGLTVLAGGGLVWGVVKALDDSADLLRRAEEVDLFVRGVDPYLDPDMTYPPSAPPVFSALIAPLPRAALRGSWLVLNLLSLAGLIWALVRFAGGFWPVWIALAFGLALTASKPVRGGMGLGQFHLIPTLLVVLALLALRTGRQVAAGVLLGIALIKPTMGLPFLAIPLARRRWRTLVVASGVQLALLMGTSAWLGIGPTRLVREWLALARGQLAAGALDLPSLLVRQWPSASVAGSWLSLVVLAGCGTVVYWRRKRSDVELAGICASAAVAFAYHRPYDLVLLAFPLAWFCEEARGDGMGLTTVSAFALAATLILPEQPLERFGLGRTYEAAFAPFIYSILLLGVLSLRLAQNKRSRPVNR